MLLSSGLAPIGPAEGEAAPQECFIGAGSGKAQGFPPGALGGGVSDEAEMELADHGVPTDRPVSSGSPSLSIQVTQLQSPSPSG